MEDKNRDLRVRRTLKLLSAALLDEMQVQPFSKITVNDVCDRAMVHRATFYNHFTGKEELLDYAFDEVQEELFEKTISEAPYGDGPLDMYMRLAANVVEYLDANRVKILNIINNTTDKMTTKLLHTISRSFRYVLARDKRNTFNLPIDVVVNFYTGGLTALAMSWLMENKYSKEEILKQFEIIVSGNILG